MSVVTLVEVVCVLVQLSDLPIEVSVPSAELEAVEWLNVEVRPLDL